MSDPAASPASSARPALRTRKTSQTGQKVKDAVKKVLRRVSSSGSKPSRHSSTPDHDIGAALAVAFPSPTTPSPPALASPPPSPPRPRHARERSGSSSHTTLASIRSSLFRRRVSSLSSEHSTAVSRSSSPERPHHSPYPKPLTDADAPEFVVFRKASSSSHMSDTPEDERALGFGAVLPQPPFVASPPLAPPAEESDEELPDPFLRDAAAVSPAAAPSPPLLTVPGLTPTAEIALSPIAEADSAAPSPITALPLSRGPSLPRPSPLAADAHTPAPPAVVDTDTESEDEDEIPEMPGLVLPQLFLPVPNTDPLTTLLSKYVAPDRRPVRDTSGEWQRTDFHTLVMTHSWRALARMARDRIVSANPEDVPLILSLWSLRLTALARLRLFNQAAAECTNLFAVLDAQPGPITKLLAPLLPFELDVFRTRLRQWAGDALGSLDALHALLRRCRREARAAGRAPVGAKRRRPPDVVAEEVAMWKERGARVSLILASQLTEMKEYTAAVALLTPLLTQADSTPSPALRSAIARIHLQAGNVGAARALLRAVAEDSAAAEDGGGVTQRARDFNAALLASADGQWDAAERLLRGACTDDDGAAYLPAVNNLAVALLAQGRVSEAIDVLERALVQDPGKVVVAEPFLFNLSTLYELRSVTAAEKKRALLVDVAKWSGDGLRTACLKMPTA